mgnify:CR=1 FL=1
MRQRGPVIGLVLDAVEPDGLARFWAEAIDYVEVGAEGSYTMLVPKGGAGPRLLFQRVPEV